MDSISLVKQVLATAFIMAGAVIIGSGLGQAHYGN